ncbi:hypothetical protein SPRG_15086 [Saprolegnia parasitica CBS 223.65]|uniref:Uncharacterized protein n=1 Tax=Saprolegnia parasitica (strain CBS 223.65) TaxID=695850 RepID=A0A067BYX3_SAPPC|nr:hypothetical protein SPRG_15086 [Saprolegnia parasitica CBS 223.65]KDO19752.1 hypothetical protein SPRG_15086 [Saprolegnia parasitica CBS 223.65]|eukprot:XP_012209515.1 hypothetical protein SPRG_15086 [Saprolegnia parasitica CBS 223.65]
MGIAKFISRYLPPFYVFFVAPLIGGHSDRSYSSWGRRNKNLLWELGPNAMRTEVLHTLAAANLQDNIAVLPLPYLSPTLYFRCAVFLLKFDDLDRTQSANSIAEHYDDGNALFKAFLDDDMVYTRASWDGLPPNALLRDAQRHKV